MESAKIVPLNKNRFPGSATASAPASPQKPRLSIKSARPSKHAVGFHNKLTTLF